MELTNDVILELMNSATSTQTVEIDTEQLILSELQDINSQLQLQSQYQLYLTGFALFLVVVVLCEKIYKFFNIFF